VSIKSERKATIRAQKQAEAGTGFHLDNASFLPDASLSQLLTLGAKAASADQAFVFVHVDESVDDGTHAVGQKGERLELHLTIPPKGCDALQSATELFRRIVTGWSFITNIQIGNNDHRAACCNRCIEVVVKEHAPVIEALARVYAKQAA
jgi:hypothetical protein